MAGNELERGDIVVQRSVHVDEDELTEELTEFAVAHGLQVRRHDEGDGMLFVRKAEMPVKGKELIRTGDTLRVIVTPTSSGAGGSAGMTNGLSFGDFLMTGLGVALDR